MTRRFQVLACAAIVVVTQLLFVGMAAAAPPPPRPQIALTIDDAPLQATRLLTVLDQKSVKTTFFLVGQYVEWNPVQAQAIASAGHLIGNHSYDHADFTNASEDEIRDNLVLTQSAILAATGVTPTWYRSPFLAENEAYDVVLPELGLTPSNPTIDPEDWNGVPAAQITSLVLANAAPGAVVLLHDGDEQQNTVDALPGLIDGLRARGYELVTLEDIGFGSIEGTVTGAGGAPLSGVTVTAYDTNGTAKGSVLTAADGRYRLSRLTPGSYRVKFSSASAGTQYYDRKSSLAQATSLVVTADRITTGIDAAMSSDAAKPVTSMSALPTGWSVGNVTFTLTATDTDSPSGLATRYRLTPPGTTATYTVPVTVSNEGTTTIAYWSIDPAGNTEAEKTASVRIDKTAPLTLSDAAATYPTAATIRLTPSDAHSGVASTRYRLDDEPAGSGTSVTTTESGLHTLEFSSADAAGNREQTRTVTFTVLDVTAPETRISSLPSGWTHEDVTFTLAATDAGHPDGITTRYRVVPPGTITSANGTVTVTVANEGTTTIEYWSVDTAGNTEAPKSATVRIDKTAPETAADAEATYVGDAIVHLTATDDRSGVSSTRYCLDGAPAVLGTTVTTGKVGPHTLEYSSIDAAGNREQTRTATFTIRDVTPPSTRISTLPTGWTADDVAFTLAATDAGYPDGIVTRYRLTPPGTTETYAEGVTVSAEGTTTIEYWSEDAAGNTEDARTAEVRIDKTAPRTSCDATSTYATEAVVCLTATDERSGVASTRYCLDGVSGTGTSVTTTRAGAHRLEYSSADAAGNREETRTITFTVDATPPVTTLSPALPAGWVTRDVSFAFTATDAGGPDGIVTRYRLTPSGDTESYTDTVTVSAEGTTRIEYWSVDVLGFAEDVRTGEVRIDKTAPVTTSDAEATYDTAATIRLSATDTHSGVASTSYSLDGADAVLGTSVSTTGIGEHTLEFFSVDEAGNREDTRRVTFTVADVDAPTTTLSPAPPTGWAADDVTFDLEATDAGHPNGIVTRYRLTPPGATSASTSRVTVTVSAEGTTSVSYWSVDTAGNIEDAKTATVRIDKAAPRTTSDARAVYPTEATIRLAATDALSGVASTRYSLDGVAGTGAVVTAAEVGAHTLEFSSVDEAGNREATQTVRFTVDVTPPSTRISDLPEGWANDDVAFTLAATDAHSPDAITTRYRLTPPGTTATYTETVTVSAEGTTRIEYWSADAVDNTEDVRTASVRIDKTAPRTTCDAEASYPSRASVCLAAEDALSGVASTRYSLDGAEIASGTVLTTDEVGEHTLEYSSVDAAGNREGTRTATFTVLDVTAPGTTLSPVPPVDWTAEDVVFDLEATDEGTPGGIVTHYRLDPPGSTSSATGKVNVTVSSEGTTTVSYWSVDGAGNIEDAKTATVRLDKTAPRTTSDAEATYPTEATIRMTATDAHSGVASTRYSLDGVDGTGDVVTTTRVGAHTLEFSSVDEAGNREATQTVRFAVDVTPPSTRISELPSAWANDDVAFTLGATDAGTPDDITTSYRLTPPGTTETYSETVTVSAEGATSIEYWSVDAVGNTEDVQSATVRIDRTAPRTTSDAEATYPDRATVTLDAEDALSGVAGTRYRLDGAEVASGTVVTTAEVGEHTLEYSSVDAAGNREGTRTATFTVLDVTAPATTLSPAPPTDWSDEDVTFELAATDLGTPGGVVTRYRLTPPGAVASCSGTVSVTVSSEGTTTVSYWSVDTAGNTEDARTATVRIDKTPPVTTSDAETTYETGAVVNLTATDELSGIASTRFALDGVEGAGDVVRAGPGSHVLEFSSADAAGNREETRTVRFRVDLTPPATRISELPTGWTTRDVTFSLTATDAGTPDDITTRYRLTTPGTTETYADPVTVSAEGTTVITYWSVDGVDNTEDAKTAEVCIDKTAPVTTCDADPTYPTTATLRLAATDEHSGVASTVYSLDGVPGTGTIVHAGLGLHTLEFSSDDVAGNREETRSVTFAVLDVTPPSTAISELPEGWTAEDVAFTLTATDTDTPDGIVTRYRLTPPGTTESYADGVTVSADGATTIEYWSVDAAGNAEDTRTAEVRIDKTAPVTTSDAESTYTAEATVRLTATDEHAGVAATVFSLDGAEIASGTVVTTAKVGPHTLEFSSVDAVGNREETRNVTFTVADGTPPVTELTPAPPTDWTAEDVTFSLAANDADTPGGIVTRYRLTPPGDVETYGDAVTVSAEGTTSIEYWSVDAVGNAEDTRTATVRIDKTAPRTTSDAEAAYATAATIRLTATDEHAGVASTGYTLDGVEGTGTVVSTAETGRHTLEFFSVDAAGNREEARTVTFVVDATPPATTLSPEPPADWSTRDVTFGLTAEDTDLPDGIITRYRLTPPSTTETYTGDVTVSAEGTTTVEYWSVDAVGNAEDAKTATVRIDKTAPVTTTDAEDSYPDRAVVRLTATDAHSGVASTRFSLDGAEIASGTVVTSAKVGSHTIEFSSIDEAGNREETRTVVFAVRDASPPATSISPAPPTGWTAEDVTFDLFATDEGTPAGIITRYRLTPPGATASSNGTVTVSVSSEGTTTVAYWSVDAVGNAEDARTVTARIDKTAPRTTSDAEAAYDARATIRFDATDALSGVAATRYSLDGAEVASGTAVTTVKVGSHRLEFFSVDEAGNREETRTVTFTVHDIGRPSTEISDLPADWTGEDVAFSLTATDADVADGIVTRYRLTPPGTTETYAETVTVSFEGTSTIEYWSTDAAGNAEDTKTATVRIDKTAPITTTDAEATYPDEAVVRLSATDEHSGVASTRYRLDGVDGTGDVVRAGLGLHVLEFSSADAVGNREDTRTVTFTVLDVTAPATVMSPLPPIAWTAEDVTIDLGATDAGHPSGIVTRYRVTPPGTTASFSGTLTVTVSNEGTTTIEYWSTDSVGNAEDAKTATVRVDKTAPRTSSDATAAYTTDATVRLSATDALSGVASTRYSLDGASAETGTVVTTAKVGSHTLEFFSVDEAGNREETRSVTFTVNDGAAPTTSLSPELPTGWTAHDVTFALVATDTDTPTGIVTRYRLTPPGTTESYTETVTVSAEGTTAIEYWSVDEAGNAETTRTGEVRIDKTAPSTSSDATDTYTTGATIHLDATDALSGVASTRYRLDGDDAVTGTVVMAADVGTHTLEFFSVDEAGNREATRSVTFTVRDVVAPVTILSPELPTGWTAHDVTFGLSAVDTDTPTGIVTRYRLTPPGTTETCTGTVTVSGEGTTTIEYWSVDEAGNAETTKTAEVCIDKTAPLTSADATDTYATDATVRLSATDAHSGVASTRYSLDGADVETGTVVTTSEVGTHTLEFSSVDEAGNREETRGVTFTVRDIEAPATTISQLPSGWSSDDVPFSLSAVDTDSPTGMITSYRLTPPGTTETYTETVTVSAEGTTTIEYWSVDGAGNPETSRTATVRIDKTAPVTTSDAVATYTANATLHLAANDAHSGVASTRYSLDGVEGTGTVVTTSGLGTHTLHFGSTDAAGNREGTRTVTFTVRDGGAPTTAISQLPAGWSATDVTFSLTATDTGSPTGIVTRYRLTPPGTTASYNGTVTVSAQGTTTVEYWSVDSAGNAEATKTATVRIDKTAPVTTSDAVATYTANATLHLAATDAHSGVASTRYTLDGATAISGTTVTTTQTGSHTLAFSSVDTAGNREATKTVTFEVLGSVQPGITYERLFGGDRYETAIAVSRKAFTGTAPAVVISTGEGFPDALCAGPLARAYGGPLLLWHPSKNAVRVNVLAELRRLSPANVFIVGGSGVVPEAAVTAIKAELPGATFVRLAGSTRYGTAEQVATRIKTKNGGVSRVVVAYGRSFPDALSVAPVAASNGWPILLTETNKLPAETLGAFGTLKPASAVVVGSDGVVSNAVFNALPVVSRLRWAGADRYETCAAIVRQSLANGHSFRVVGLARGDSFPDALAAGPMLAAVDGVILLTRPASLPPAIATVSGEHRGEIDEVLVIGAEGVLPQSTCDQLKDCIE